MQTKSHNLSMLGIVLGGLAIAIGVLIWHASSSWQSQTLPGYAKGNGQAYTLNGPVPTDGAGQPTAGSGGHAAYPPVVLPFSKGRIIDVKNGEVAIGFPFTRAKLVPASFFAAERGNRYVALYSGASGSNPRNGLVLVWLSAPYGVGAPTSTWMTFARSGTVTLTGVSLSSGAATVRDSLGRSHSISF
jgi:hypothetical protein